MRLLDVGCGWGGMVRHAVTHYGVTAIGVTLSKEQAAWGAARLEREGLADRGVIRHGDYRDVAESGFDAVSSIGLTEHIGVSNYPAYFRFLRSRLCDGGRLLNHSITRPDNQHPGIPSRGFINRYVFPDGGITGSGTIVEAMEDQGLEVRHQENLREHYAMTTRDWCRNLSDNWDAAVAEVGLGVARVWGLYLAGSRAVVRAQPDPAAPGARLQDHRRRRLRVRAATDLGELRSAAAAGATAPQRGSSTSAKGGHDQSAEDRADDAAGPQLEAVAAQEAGQKAADQRPDETGDERHRPVDALASPAQDELSGRADQHAEEDDRDDEHGRSVTGPPWASPRRPPASSARRGPARSCAPRPGRPRTAASGSRPTPRRAGSPG